jgi:predicted permease
MSLLAVSILALGMAAPVTFFSLLAGSIRHLPVPEGHRIIRVEVRNPETGGGPVPVTLGDLPLVRESGSLEGLGAFRVFDGTLVDPGKAALRLSGATLSTDVLPLLRVAPVLGRVPGDGEESAGILLGYEVWKESYGENPDVMGREVFLNDERHVVTGVLPEGFGFPFRQQVWAFFDSGAEDSTPVELVGRLSKSGSHEAASVELSGLWARGDGFRRPAHRGGKVEVDSFTGGRGERAEGVAFLGLVLVALALLVIACTNVANLLLVRATDRIQSLAVQSALGAGKVQLSAQLFLEALLLAVIGGGGGLFLAWLGVDAIQSTLAREHFGYFWMRMAIDARVMVFASILVCGTAVFSGTIPIVRLLKADLQSVMKEGRSRSVIGGGGRWGRWFVSLQLALSCAALVAAGLTGQTLARSSGFGRGLPSEETLVASLDPLGGAEMTATDREGRLLALMEALSAVPGSKGAALALGAPGYLEPFSNFSVEGREVQRNIDQRGSIWNAVTPEYFSLFGIELRAGRTLGPEDREDSTPVAVVNEAFASLHFPGEDPLGRRLTVPRADTETVFVIVGVVEDIDMGGGPAAVNERIYVPLFQVSHEDLLALARSETDAADLAPGLRQAVAGLDPRIPIWSVRSLSDAHAFMTRVPRSMAGIALVGGLGGLLVASVGFYGLLAFRVRQRRRELGVRMALGAHGGGIMLEVLLFALRQLLPAVGIGLGLAWLMAPILGVVLMGSDPRSPLTFLFVAVAFMAVGLASALVPAFRAASVEPAEVLRGE